jgi:tetratricopeptide (TPR) repeat protein
MALSNLALAHDLGNEPKNAERLYLEAAEIIEATLGPSAPVMGSILNNMAAAVFAQCRLAEAERIYTRALSVYSRNLKPAHRDVLAAKNNIRKIRSLLRTDISRVSVSPSTPEQDLADPRPAERITLPPTCVSS